MAMEQGKTVIAVLIVLACFIVVLCLYLWRLAVRLDRLHRRVLSTSWALDRALVKRAATSLQVADFGFLPLEAATDLARAAKAALAVVDVPVYVDQLRSPILLSNQSTLSNQSILSPKPLVDKAETQRAKLVERLLIESELSRVIRGIVEESTKEWFRADEVGAPLLGEFQMACYKVQVARRLYNQDVRQVHYLRQKLLVRLFHLAGHAALPDFVDLDDET